MECTWFSMIVKWFFFSFIFWKKKKSFLCVCNRIASLNKRKSSIKIFFNSQSNPTRGRKRMKGPILWLVESGCDSHSSRRQSTKIYQFFVPNIFLIIIQSKVTKMYTFLLFLLQILSKKNRQIKRFKLKLKDIYKSSFL